MDEEEYLSRLEEYIEMGAIDIAGIDENGEVVFQIMEIAKEIAPELWESHERWINDALIDLFENDLISVEYDENLEATINLTKEGYEIAKERGIIPIDLEDGYEGNL